MPIPAILTSLVEAYAPPQKPPVIKIPGDPGPEEVLKRAYKSVFDAHPELERLPLSRAFRDYQPTLWRLQWELEYSHDAGTHALQFMEELKEVYGFNNPLRKHVGVVLEEFTPLDSGSVQTQNHKTVGKRQLVVLTGGASEDGIGREIAQTKIFLNSTTDVIITSSKDASRAERVARALPLRNGQRVWHGVADVFTQGDDLITQAVRLAVRHQKEELVLYLGAYLPRHTMRIQAAHYRMVETAMEALQGTEIKLRVVLPVSPAYGPHAAKFQGLRYSGGELAKLTLARACQQIGVEAWAIRAPITTTSALVIDPVLASIMHNAEYFGIRVCSPRDSATAFLVAEATSRSRGAVAHADLGVWNLPEHLPLNRAVTRAALMQAGKELGIGMGAGLLVSGLLDMTVGRAFEKSGRTFTEWNRLVGTAEHDLGYEIARNLLSSVAVNFLLGYRLKTGLLFVGAVTLVGAGLSTAVRTEWPATPRLGVDAGTSFAASTAHIARGFMRLLG